MCEIIKGLLLVRHPLAYTSSERVIEILSLSNLDPLFVDEAAKGFGILAEGKGKGKERGSHLTTKVSRVFHMQGIT
jgi:DNA repair/transcription protein MET18/MMS19